MLRKPLARVALTLLLTASLGAVATPSLAAEARAADKPWAAVWEAVVATFEALRQQAGDADQTASEEPPPEEGEAFIHIDPAG